MARPLLEPWTKSTSGKAFGVAGPASGSATGTRRSVGRFRRVIDGAVPLADVSREVSAYCRVSKCTSYTIGSTPGVGSGMCVAGLSALPHACAISARATKAVARPAEASPCLRCIAQAYRAQGDCL